MNDAASDSAHAPDQYRVLARKYRPRDFSELAGQDVLVKTLTHAIETGRVAHAFMLTGVRGIGKTTTARIIARALNCVGPDGNGGPTATPCGECEHCIAIAEDRHVDVIEMDAASHTGVDNIRDLNDSARYRPVSARYKVYIIDEVHMLSRGAFNALLKTLEEPPEHLKFVFATTEIRKVPITVLSRCQRFDLRRLDQAELAAHLKGIADKEGATVDEPALAMLARAADGSVRDGLSLLDQAIGQAAGAAIDGPTVRAMLGLADRSQIVDLLDAVMKGEAKTALELAGELYRAGADPLIVIQDLLETVHTLTRRKLGASAEPGEDGRLGEMAEALGMGVLSRAWQMLLKGVGEVQMAPQPLTALEMLLVRLCYVAELPPPGDLVKTIEAGGGVSVATPAAAPTGGNGGGGNGGARAYGGGSRPEAQPYPEDAPPAPDTDPRAEAAPQPQSLREVAELFKTRREVEIYSHLLNDVHPVRFEVGRIEFRPREEAPRNLANRMGDLLSQWTGQRWVVSISGEEGQPTLHEQAEAEEAARKSEASRDPLVQAVLDTFPGARIEAVRPLNPEAESPPPPDDDQDEDPS